MTLYGVITVIFTAMAVSFLSTLFVGMFKEKVNKRPDRVWYIIYKKGYDRKYYACEAFDDEFHAQIIVRILSNKTPRTKYKLVEVQKKIGQSVAYFNVQRYTDLYQIRWMRRYVLKARTVKKFQKII